MIRVLTIVGAMVSVASSHASTITYSFSGSVTTSSSAPFGLVIPRGTALSGFFKYSNDSLKAYTFAGDGSGYTQHIADGFVVDFGDIRVSTTDYLVEVYNRSTPSSDTITIGFRGSGLTPPLESGIAANGLTHSLGQFSLSLSGNGSALLSSALPPIINPAEFPVRVGFLNDTFPGQVDVMFTLDSLSVVQVPEPSSILLLAIASVIGLVRPFSIGTGTRDDVSMHSN